MEFINKIFRGDRVVWMIFMFLCLISIVEVYSASSTLTFKQNYWGPIMRHTTFLLAGTGVVLLVHSIKPKFFSLLIFILPLAWILMISTRFLGTSVNGADRWINIAGFTFQPSELAKICLIGSAAFILSKQMFRNPKDKSFWLLSITTLITCGIILIDNFSTAFLLFGIIFLMMFVAQVSYKKLFQLLAILAIAGGLFVSLALLFPQVSAFKRVTTWVNRIDDFKQSDNDKGTEFVINDDNYQVSHAKIAIARGGIFGKLPGNSQQRDYLPQAYSDFIFAIIIEELGLIGGGLVLFLYIILFIRSGMIASRCEKLFPKLLVMGCAMLLVSQALANMAVAVNLIPVTGQPLPLISRGGTSTLITCAYVGIILSVSRFENPRGIKREEAILVESEEEAQLAREKAFIEENINAGEF